MGFFGGFFLAMFLKVRMKMVPGGVLYDGPDKLLASQSRKNPHKGGHTSRTWRHCKTQRQT